MNRPPNIASRHWQEWLDSGVDPEIIALNVRSLHGDIIYEYLCQSNDIPRRNTGRLTDHWLRKYAGIAASSAWWCSGVDPLANNEPMEWGSLKPDKPRVDFQDKTKRIKYEHPARTATRAFFLRVPLHIWQKISEIYGVAMPTAGYAYDPEDLELGFWGWVWLHNLPITITEGAKKAGALLTAGTIAIGLPGITGGYRNPKDEAGKPTNKLLLIPELEYFATPGREITFCFDTDRKQRTRFDVQRAIARTGRLMTQCKVKVITIPLLPGTSKTGADDFIVAQGEESWKKLVARDLSTWEAQLSHQLTYSPDLLLNQRYLGDLPFPEAGFVVVRSAKGTGKTKSLVRLISDAIGVGRRVLIIGHRIQLVRDICNRLGINYIDEVRESQTGALLGYGLCVDSLHPKGQARFRVEDWEGAIVILDECEQVIWHGLNSSTCYEKRVSILETLSVLLKTVLSTGGLVIAQDADISDISVDYIKGLAGFDIKPWVVVNEWKSKPWTIHFSHFKDPSELWRQVEEKVTEGAVFIALDSQKAKSVWSASNDEAHLQRRFPDKKILRIDSQTVADPNHPAYGCVENLNEIVTKYDIIIASPTIATGISIDVRGYFVAVFGIFKGAIPPTEVLQALARVRDESVPRYIWARRYGVGRVGNGSTDYRGIVRSLNKIIKTNIHLLKITDFDIDTAHDPIHLRTWAKMAARVNAGMINYRQSIYDALVEEGHNILSSHEDFLRGERNRLTAEQVAASNAGEVEKAEELYNQVAAVRDELNKLEREAAGNKEAAIATKVDSEIKECQAVENAAEITDGEADLLNEKRNKTREETLKLRKHQLKSKYGVDINADLVLKDNQGWHPKWRLHYYFIHNPAYVDIRDKKHLVGHLERGIGKLCPQDLRLIKGKVEALKVMDLDRFLDCDREYRGTDPDVIEWAAKMVKLSREIKTYLGVTIREQDSPMKIAQIILSTVGLKLTGKQQRVSEGRERVYRFVPPTDSRDRIFAVWEEWDLAALEKNETFVTDPSIYRVQTDSVTEPPNPSIPDDDGSVADGVKWLMFATCRDFLQQVFQVLSVLPQTIKAAIWRLIPDWRKREIKLNEREVPFL